MPSELDSVEKLFAAQIETKDAFAKDVQIISQQGIGTSFDFGQGGHKERQVEVMLSRDGKSAWASGLTSVTKQAFEWRISDVMVKTATGWQIAAMMVTRPVDNATVNKQAKAGTWKPVPLTRRRAMHPYKPRSPS